MNSHDLSSGHNRATLFWLRGLGVYEHVLQHILGLLQRRQLRHPGIALDRFDGEFDINQNGGRPDGDGGLNHIDGSKRRCEFAWRRNRWYCGRMYCRNSSYSRWDMVLDAEEDADWAKSSTGGGGSKVSGVGTADGVL